jgi:hypothetical protein
MRSMKLCVALALAAPLALGGCIPHRHHRSGGVVVERRDYNYNPPPAGYVVRPAPVYVPPPPTVTYERQIRYDERDHTWKDHRGRKHKKHKHDHDRHYYYDRHDRD